MPVTIAPAAGTAPLRWPAIAYGDGRYLAISGAGKVTGQFLDDDAVPMGAPFAVNAGTNLAQAPRVTYAAGKFFVTWHETVGSATQIRARYVTTSPIGGDFDVSPLGTNWEMGAASAFNGKELLVAWQNTATAIVAQRVGDAAIGAPIPIDATGRYQRDPTVVAQGSDFLVVYAGCVADKNCFVEAQRVRDGALVGERLVLDSAIDAGYVPEAAATETGDVLVVWYRVAAGAKSFVSRVIHADGTLGSPVTVSSTFGSYDANGLAYDARSRSFLFVTHGDSSQDMAVELSLVGAPLTTTPFGPMGSGNFNPRVAASTARPEWIAVTSTEFETLTAQRFSTAEVSATDAGIADAAVDAEPIGDSLPPRDSSPRNDITSDPASGSCGCGVPRTRTPGAAIALLLLLVGRRWRRST